MNLFNKFLSSIVLLLCFILLITSCAKEETMEPNNIQSEKIVTKSSDEMASNRSECDPCNCNALYDQYLSAYQLCVLWGTDVYCDYSVQLYYQYQNCLNKEPECPLGFTFDGCNCHSGTYFPEGYEGFVHGNGFYVKQNCQISTANNCCPSGFTFDGANCHSGVYFPEGYEGFVYDNAFYTFAIECE